jgi:hypothetical protein
VIVKAQLDKIMNKFNRFCQEELKDKKINKKRDKKMR